MPQTLLQCFHFMEAHFKKQYLLQILKKSTLNLFTGIFFLEMHTLKVAFAYKILKKGALNIVTGFFLKGRL